MKNLGKKSMSLILSLVLIISSVGIVYADEPNEDKNVEDNLEAVLTDLKVKLNGSKVLDETVVIDGKSYLPLEKMCELLEIEFSYDDENRTIEINSSQENDKELFHGNVKFVYSNGTIYEGGYRNGQFNGDGTINYPDGSMYEGNFVNGVIEGEGEYTASNGDVYVGQFVNNDYCGHGKYTCLNGNSIEGKFESSKIKGYARVKISGEDEARQMGGYDWTSHVETMDISSKAFDLHKYNGTADLIYANGDHYDGALTDDCYNGNGTLISQDGSTYKGNWIMNKKSGNGTITYADGSMYKGYFLNGQYDGQGKMYYVNGDVYDGAWKLSKKEGYGRYTEANGNYFYGMWKNDVKHTLDEDDDEDYKEYGTYVKNSKNTGCNKSEYYKQKWENGELLKQRKDK